MKKIKLTHDKYALVDDEDFDFLNQWKWHLSDKGYAHRSEYIKKGINTYSSKTIRMHRLINKTKFGFSTDHINRNKLDNRKSNLRTVTQSLNGLNRNKSSRNISGFNGVHFDSWTKKWRAEIKVDGKKMSLGRFFNIKDAISARKTADSKINFYATV